MDKSTTINLSAALSIFDDQLNDIRKACVENVKYEQMQYPTAKQLDVTEDITKQAIRDHVAYLKLDAATKPRLQVIRRIDGRRKYVSGKSITDADIERAREYPIEQLWEELVGTPIRHSMVSCPFHGQDKNPSMSIRKYNRYRCFTCDAKGDVIDLYMRVNGVDFITAVKGLRGMM